tara:strand:- start:1139 stop:2935 length:1797 start_codon:yes stop_codon:yes gene_type:complete
MCGIIAILSNINIIQNALDGLTQLQNRGYDSAGLSFIDNNKLETYKFASTNKMDSIDKLASVVNAFNSNNIIAHTRWATHGGKTDINSHPHVSYDNEFSIVHNGIIENYQEHKKFLEHKKIFSVSQTDSEIIVNLLAYNYSILLDITKAIHATSSSLKGTWALAIIHKTEPYKIYCIRNKSPLIIGVNENMIIVSSEISGFNGKISKTYSIADGELVIISKQNDILSHSCKSEFKLIDNTQQIALTPEPYKYWLEKEINDQYITCRKAYNNRLLDNEVFFSELRNKEHILYKINNIIIIGCGSSLYASELGEYYFKNTKLFFNVSSYDAAEFNTGDIPKVGSTCIIMLSQSGETRDVIKVLDLCKNNNILTIGIVNVENSYISLNTDYCIYLHAGREVSVASTKSFTSQLIVLKLLSCWFSRLNYKDGLKYDLEKLHSGIFQIITNINNNYQQYISFLDKPSLFVLGKGKYYFIAKEAALKIKELTYNHAEGYSGSALKHGAYSLLTDQFPVILIIMDDEYKSLMLSCYEEIKSRNAYILVITDIVDTDFENKIIIPKNNLSEIYIIIVLQYLSFYIAKSKNLSIDRPRNLAKCVTTD